MRTNNQASTAFAALDRRAFVAGAAVVAAGTAALATAAHADEAAPVVDDRNGTSARAAQETADETVECDVVIAGAGIAGLMAADHLVEQGFKVCLLEKGAGATFNGGDVGAFESQFTDRFNYSHDAEGIRFGGTGGEDDLVHVGP